MSLHQVGNHTRVPTHTHWHTHWTGCHNNSENKGYTKAMLIASMSCGKTLRLFFFSFFNKRVKQPKGVPQSPPCSFKELHIHKTWIWLPVIRDDKCMTYVRYVHTRYKWLTRVSSFLIPPEPNHRKCKFHPDVVKKKKKILKYIKKEGGDTTEWCQEHLTAFKL